MYSLIGLKFDPITNEGADLKSTWHGPSLTPAQREYLQGQVNDLAREFKEFVAAHRSASLSQEVQRAGAYHGSRAVALGLADQIGTLDDTYKNLQLAIQMEDEMNTPEVDTQPTERRTGYLRVENLNHLKDMEQKELENQTSAESQAEATDIKSVLTQLSTDIKSLANPNTSLAALETKIDALTAGLESVKAYSEAVNQRCIALEASRGTPVGVKVDHKEGLDKNSAVRQQVNETITGIKAKLGIST